MDSDHNATMSSSTVSTPSRSTTLVLPPRYRGWLRALIRQWIDQQLGDSDGMPGLLTTHRKLWSDTKSKGLEETIWTCVVMPQREEGKRGLLEVDWERWIALAMKRMQTWKIEEAKRHASIDKTPNTPSNKTVKALRRSTQSDIEIPSRARLASSGTPAALASLMGSSMGTPIKSPGRPPSVASAHSTPRPDSFSDQLTAGLQRTVSGPSSDGSDLLDPLELFCDRVRAMKGYQPFDAPVRDEWEVVQGKSNDVPNHVHRSPLPGAFPQTGTADDEPPLPPVKSAHTLNSEQTKDCTMLKPVFCLHFPPPPVPTAPSNTSTVRLTRDSSSSNLQSNQTWWGSGRRWSEMTLKPGDDLETLSITFIEGKFALPHAGKRPKTDPIQRLHSSSSIDSSDASLVGTETNDGTPESEVDAHSTTDKSARQGTNIVIGGKKDDIPNEVDPDTIGLVGGTFVVRGMPDQQERMALERILQRLLYTIQSAVIELGLLDAFRVAKESEPHESPPKADPFEGPRSSFGRPRRDSVDKKIGEKKGFLHRLHRDTRGVFGGFFRPPRKNENPREIPEDPLPSLSHRTTPSFDSLGIPPAPVGPVYDGFPDTPDRPYTLGQSTTGTPYVYSSIDTHLELLSNLEQIKMSTTPGLVIPAPILLQRVKKEEEYRHERVTNGSTGSAHGHHTSSDDDGDRPSGNRLGGDLRTGLKGLRSGLDTFEGWTRLQRLDTVRCVAVDESKQDPDGQAESTARVCDRPQTESLVFYDSDSDTSIMNLLQTLKHEMGDMAACTRSGCVATAHDHKRCWYHGEKKVTLRATPREEVEGKPDTVLRAWVSCAVCKCASDSKVMTDTAACQSWGKFMELLVYSNIVRPAKLCEHNETEHLAYHFQTGGISVAISVEAAAVLDIRLPRFQVGPAVQKRKAATGAIEDTLDALVPVHTAQDEPTPKEVLVNEVKDYFQSLHKWCDQLDRDIMFANMTDPEKPRQPTDIQPAERIDAHRNLVTRMRQCEMDVIKDISITPDGVLNEARALFVRRINFYFDEFTQFRKNFEVPGNCDDLPLRLPEYYDGKYHALSGSHVVLREDDPASIIAYTLSCLTYLTELTPNKSPAPTAKDLLERKSSPDSTRSVNSGWTIEMKRRDNPKDLFALRGLTKKQSGVPATRSKAITAMTVTPTTPSLELSLEQVQGRPEPSDNLSELVKSIHKAAAQDPVLSMKANSPHLVSRPTVDSIPDVTVHRSPTKASKRLTNDMDGLPPPSFKPLRSDSGSISSLPLTPNQSDEAEDQAKEGWGSVTSSFSNALYRLGSGVGETLGSFRMRGGERSLSSMLGPLSTMSQADNALATSASNQFPHIQFTYTLGDKLKLACTVYHAEPFDSLRRRCAIDKEIISSLCNVENWDVSGGKSKALFFRTKDRRFVIKELVTKWTVSDTNAMLELSPSYFEYMQSTFNKATSLIKIVGFYSVTTHDRQSGVKKQMDLLIMEDLFHKQDISKTFDLKGIEGRKVPKANAPTTSVAGEAKLVSPDTLFDADWLESMAKSPIMIHPHAKRILTDAIAADTKFLSSQSVMDYSLLLGLDSARKELVVGIVDSIGSYNLWKTIESRGKLALTRGGEVTVIPPDQYKDRFENALNKYFITCPDKWSRTGKRHTGALTSFL